MRTHPYFDSLPDRYAAEALSEAFVVGEYKNNYSLKDTPFTQSDGFPPEPAYLSSVTAAFLERDGKTVGRTALHDISGRDVAPTDTEAIQAYDLNVGTYQRQASLIEPWAHHLGIREEHPKFGRLGYWAVEATKRSGHRLIAAHLIFRSPTTHRVHSALTYPAEFKDEFPLVIREAFEPLVIAMKEGGIEDVPSYNQAPQLIREYIDGMMHNSEELTVQAGLPAGAVMPPPSSFRQALRMHRKQSDRR